MTVTILTGASDSVSAGVGSTSQSTSITVASKPANLTDGDLLLAVAVNQTAFTVAGQALSVDAAEWVRVGPAATTNSTKRPSGMWIMPVPTASAVTTTGWTWRTSGSPPPAGGRWLIRIYRVTGVDLAAALDSAASGWSGPAGPGTTAANVASLTTIHNDALVVYHLHGNAAAGVGIPVVTSPGGTTKLETEVYNSASASTESLFVYHEPRPTPGATGTRDFITDRTLAAFAGFQIALNPQVTAPTLKKPKVRIGGAWVEKPLMVRTASAWVQRQAQVWDGTQWTTTWVGTSPAPAGRYATVAEMLTDPGFTVAHRGGSKNWAEMSLHAYQQSAAAGYGALELSLAKSSDGQWFGLHDADINRVAGTTGLPAASTMTWAAIRAYQIQQPAGGAGGPQPFMRLEDFLAMFRNTHVIFIDPKHQIGSAPALSGLLDIMDANGGPNRFVAKYNWSNAQAGTSWADLVHARNPAYRTWGYYYTPDLGNLAGTHGDWDLLGLECTATAGSWATITAVGKLVIAHTVTTQAQADASAGMGADGFMVENVLAVAP